MDRNRLPDGASHLCTAYQQLKAEFPEVQAVNAMYTQACWRLSPPKNATVALPARWAACDDHATRSGLREDGDYGREDVDPFNLPQVMWALSSKVNRQGIWCSCRICPCWNSTQAQPSRDHRQADYRRHHACRPGNRGHYSQPVVDLPETKAWAEN